MTPDQGYAAARAPHEERLRHVTPGETWKTEIKGLPLHGLTVQFA